jgi:hypothetical protein
MTTKYEGIYRRIGSDLLVLRTAPQRDLLASRRDLPRQRQTLCAIRDIVAAHLEALEDAEKHYQRTNKAKVKP